MHTKNEKNLTHLTPKDSVSPNCTVIGTLGAGKAHFGPAERMTVQVQQGVFLLNPKPGMGVCHSRHHLPINHNHLPLTQIDHTHLCTGAAVISNVRVAIFVLSLTQYEAVVARDHGIVINGHWLHVDITVLPY